MPLETKLWDAAEYLQEAEQQASYLAYALEESDTFDIVSALKAIARARGQSIDLPEGPLDQLSIKQVLTAARAMDLQISAHIKLAA